ncbi:MAG: precorrin-8X methylmutase [Syntrophobacterales bacterium]|nr:precorrin-8X methylmutase [Syntrophobacterales bacterium]
MSNYTHEELREIVPAGLSIEEESFKIIDREIKDHNFDELQWMVVRRVIHSTGDLEFSKLIHFHQNAIEAGVEVIKRGGPIFVDTRMIAVGLSPSRLKRFGIEVKVPVTNSESRELAERLNITRSAAAFRLMAKDLNGALVAIGNAPTALMEVIRIMRDKEAFPSLVIGVPVGFVQAAESKELLRNMSFVPSITVEGRKGGSPVAISILHAIIDIAGNKLFPRRDEL